MITQAQFDQLLELHNKAAALIDYLKHIEMFDGSETAFKLSEAVSNTSPILYDLQMFVEDRQEEKETFASPKWMSTRLTTKGTADGPEVTAIFHVLNDHRLDLPSFKVAHDLSIAIDKALKRESRRTRFYVAKRISGLASSIGEE